MTDTVTPKQQKAIEALVLSGSVTEAAKAGGVNRKTLYVWLKQPAFKLALKEAEATALDNLSRRLVSLSDKAAGTLETVLDDLSTSAGHRLRASDIILSNLLRVKELVDLEARILALEQSSVQNPP